MIKKAGNRYKSIKTVQTFSVKLHLRDGRTDEETRLFVRPSVRSFVSLSIVSVGEGGASIL